MQFTYQFAVYFRDMLRENPLAPNEVRKVPKMDDWFITSADTKLDSEEYKELFRIKIDDVSVVVYKLMMNKKFG
jgi:hypothetical protein